MRIPDLSGSPRDWTIEPMFTFTGVELGCSVRVADHVVALVVDKERNGLLVRWSDDALVRGDLTEREVWNGVAWASDGAAVVISQASSRCSLFPETQLSSTWNEVTWVYSASRADGTIAYREATRLEGPYTAPQTMSMPTVEGDEFAYGGRVHQLTDDGLRLVTFMVTEPGALFDPARDDDLLWPRVGRAFVSITIE